ncbi:methyltransferase small [Thermocrinis albus DSM 14484]|uniref:Methyltransferase small n=1 Tax=Thermocrinis albus (strain DSM 14484 / JCM 11386 / HI 11/12) TaxID=638303 RepID=D3SM15_THEAH|nr:methyltransferase [Thermocrinis albus]ADC89795.1 methyltransferase small [Thermocrinis albus DSM 14484]
METFKEFEFFRGKVKFRQPRRHRLSIIEILFVAHLRGIKRTSTVVDLGAGFGALSVLTALRYSCHVLAVERDSLMLELLRYNVKVNQLQDKVSVVEGDVRDVEHFLKRYTADAVIVNPPFYPAHWGSKDGGYHFEMDTKLEDFIKASSYLLKDGGHLNILIPSFRFLEAVENMKRYNIAPVHVMFFYPKLSKNARLVRIHGRKNMRSQMIIEKPLIINTEDGSYERDVALTLDSFFMV